LQSNSDSDGTMGEVRVALIKVGEVLENAL